MKLWKVSFLLFVENSKTKTFTAPNVSTHARRYELREINCIRRLHITTWNIIQPCEALVSQYIIVWINCYYYRDFVFFLG